MTGNEYQRLAARTINPELGYGLMKRHGLHGMSSEIGEIHGIYQKWYQGHVIDSDHIKKEVGDLLWFIAEFCTGNGWDLDDIFEMNIEKLRKRYPGGFDVKHSINRDEDDI